MQREFNLSFSAQQPPWNTLAQGMWQTADARGISMEEGIMQTLGLRLGDKVMFDMGGVQRESAITSVRKVNCSRTRRNPCIGVCSSSRSSGGMWELSETLSSSTTISSAERSWNTSLTRR